MTQYNSLNVKLENSQLNTLNPAKKKKKKKKKGKERKETETEIVFRLSSNMIRNYNDETKY